MAQSFLKMLLLSREPVLIIKISLYQAHSHLPRHASVTRKFASFKPRSFRVPPKCTLTSFNLTLPLPYLNLPSSNSTYLHVTSLTLLFPHLASLTFQTFIRIIYDHIPRLVLTSPPLIYLQMPSLNITCLCCHHIVLHVFALRYFN